MPEVVDIYNDVDILARTLYGEAESDNHQDAKAIAAVVMNRVHYHQWPDSAAAVCLQPWQFSCWNHNDPNRERILKAKGKWFSECQKIAEQAVLGKLPDTTNVSTHYFQTKLVQKPKWAKGHTPVYVIEHKFGGGHAFFNDIDTPPPKTAAQALEQQKPLSSSRTVKGAQLATTSLAASTAVEAVEDLKVQVVDLIPYLDTVKYIFVFLTLLGLAITVYARIDDRRRGLR